MSGSIVPTHVDEHVFAIITAGDCGACRMLESTINDIAHRANDIDEIGVLRSHVATRGDVLDAKTFPLGFQSYIRWYPIFLLIDKNSWNNGFGHNATPVKPIVLNGYIVPDGKGNQILRPSSQIGKPEVPVNVKNVINWIQTSLKLPSFIAHDDNNQPQTNTPPLSSPPFPSSSSTPGHSVQPPRQTHKITIADR